MFMKSGKNKSLSVIGVTALLSVFIFIEIADAKCLSTEERSSACRYPQGDSWCSENDKNNPYAYSDSCLSRSNPSQTTTSIARVNTPGDGFLALRSDPSAKIGTRLDKIPHETKLKLENCNFDSSWCKTTYDGKSGWVFTKYLQYKKEKTETKTVENQSRTRGESDSFSQGNSTRSERAAAAATIMGGFLTALFTGNFTIEPANKPANTSSEEPKKPEKAEAEADLLISNYPDSGKNLDKCYPENRQRDIPRNHTMWFWKPEKKDNVEYHKETVAHLISLSEDNIALNCKISDAGYKIVPYASVESIVNNQIRSKGYEGDFFDFERLQLILIIRIIASNDILKGKKADSMYMQTLDSFAGKFVEMHHKNHEFRMPAEFNGMPFKKAFNLRMEGKKTSAAVTNLAGDNIPILANVHEVTLVSSDDKKTFVLSSNIRLKGRYIVKVKFTQEITAALKTNLGGPIFQAFTDQMLRDTERKDYYVDFFLNEENGYKDKKIVDFSYLILGNVSTLGFSAGLNVKAMNFNVNILGVIKE